MSDKSKKMTDLANRYLDLWQNQITAMASDAETAKMFERSMLMFNQGVCAFTGSVKSVKEQTEENCEAANNKTSEKENQQDNNSASFNSYNYDDALKILQRVVTRNVENTFKSSLGTADDSKERTNENNTAAKNGAKTTPSSSVNANVDVNELLRSFKSMEERIIRLESELEKRS
ncbi:MAG: hypothetical protein GY804_14530 [Alphaproteobacteria bacterium]|nr:hypothetical protein [Alphaproteobacteria bacterium]